MAKVKGYRGIDQLRRTLRRLPKEMQTEVKVAVREGAEAIKVDAQVLAPKNTGELATNIGVKISKDGFAAQIGFSEKLFPREWHAAGWRAKFVEYGTAGYKVAVALVRERVSGGAGERKYRLVEKEIYRRTTKGSKTTHVGTRDVPARPAQPFLRPAFDTNRKWAADRIKAAISNTINRLRAQGK